MQTQHNHCHLFFWHQQLSYNPVRFFFNFAATWSLLITLAFSNTGKSLPSTLYFRYNSSIYCILSYLERMLSQFIPSYSHLHLYWLTDSRSNWISSVLKKFSFCNLRHCTKSFWQIFAFIFCFYQAYVLHWILTKVKPRLTKWKEQSLECYMRKDFMSTRVRMKNTMLTNTATKVGDLVIILAPWLALKKTSNTGKL